MFKIVTETFGDVGTCITVLMIGGLIWAVWVSRGWGRHDPERPVEAVKDDGLTPREGMWYIPAERMEEMGEQVEYFEHHKTISR